MHCSVQKLIAAHLRQFGFANAYGDQRFGHYGSTAELGFELIRGSKQANDIPYKRRRFLLKLAYSAAQSTLFNRVLSDRINAGTLTTVLKGDVLQKRETGGLFVAENVESEQQRLEANEVVITGPMYGPKMRKPEGIVAEQEASLLAEYHLSSADFARNSKFTPGTRRPLAIVPEEFEVAADPDGVRFRFVLPSGVYATSLLHEFLLSRGELTSVTPNAP